MDSSLQSHQHPIEMNEVTISVYIHAGIHSCRIHTAWYRCRITVDLDLQIHYNSTDQYVVVHL